MPTIEPAVVEWAHPQIDDNWKANRDVWVEVSEAFYMEMLEVVPPVLFGSRQFMVGEAYTHNERGSVRTGFVQIGERYFARTCNTVDFRRLSAELRASFR